MTSLTPVKDLVVWTTSDPQSLASASAAMMGSVEAAIKGTELNTYRWGSSTERDAETGMTTGDLGVQTDSNTLWVYTGLTWVRQSVLSQAAVFAGSTNVNGIITVPHTLPVVPAWAFVQVRNDGTSDPLAKILSPIVWDNPFVGSSVQIRFRRTDTNDWAANQPVQGFLMVGV